MSGITAQEAFNRLDSITTKEELFFFVPNVHVGNAYKLMN